MSSRTSPLPKLPMFLKLFQLEHKRQNFVPLITSVVFPPYPDFPFLKLIRSTKDSDLFETGEFESAIYYPLPST